MDKLKQTSVILVLFTALLFPQQSNTGLQPDMIFSDAVKMYNDGNYRDALGLFNKIINDFNYNSKTTASVIFKGKILISLKNFTTAENLLRDFIKKFSDSRYVDEARFTLAKVYLEKNEYLYALTELLYLYSETKSDFYSSEARKLSQNLSLQYLTTAEIQSVNIPSDKSKIRSLILLILGKLHIDNGRLSDAKEAFANLTRLYPDSPDRAEADLITASIKTTGNTITTQNTLIGVMIPFSGLENTLLNASREILEGIKYAVSEFNNGREDKVGLVIMDTGNDRNKISRIRETVELNPSIKVMFGPVFSSEVSIALEEFKSSNIPLISPTATDNDLTLINENFFQANPNFIVRAKAMAQYIYYVENKRKIAVLNSIDGYSPLLAAEFIKEFNKLGGEIVIKSTYRSGSLSAGNQLVDFSNRLSDAEGIYIPLSDRADAPLLLSQLVQNKIDMPLFGSQDWFLARGFETSPELSNKMTFASDYYIDYNSDSYKQFNKEFISRTRIEANRNVLYGYDAAKYLLTVLRNIIPDRENIKMKMESGISVNGYHNNILFDTNRVNRFLNIVRYRDGIFELVDKFKANI